ncbi:alternative ribosome rescue aminoacyl-tRNA hydrolase ArfB [Chamaesiphon sp. GL140_3_metabinner_50]|uniref:alternative ribosome rescue aminoacyl-tRNA hydrolase ArfB n=1 Tax=Chamaesiphon sp. GL140_3_metabinner_50 TaxID=2970812 RepID=UPI0025EE9066|nr:alternative ribosome rescue aminoacyl-tRNA hydrolase ArfB [Chamaesiphon sp. GL140_3_metabinner_50]
MFQISKSLSIPASEIDISAIRSQGAGGQNVNKVATAIHLRFDIMASSLPDWYKERLLQLRDRRVTNEGTIVIKSQEHRSQERNRDEAFDRLRSLILSVAVVVLPRKLTKPSRGQNRRRLEDKKRQSQIKALRKDVE